MRKLCIKHSQSSQKSLWTWLPPPWVLAEISKWEFVSLRGQPLVDWTPVDWTKGSHSGRTLSGHDESHHTLFHSNDPICTCTRCIAARRGGVRRRRLLHVCQPNTWQGWDGQAEAGCKRCSRWTGQSSEAQTSRHWTDDCLIHWSMTGCMVDGAQSAAKPWSYSAQVH